MRKILCLAFIVAAVSLVSAPPPTSGCFDYDRDGVCFANDCDDRNPFASEEDGIDGDGDGLTLCQGDCEDNDPTVQKCQHTIEKTPPASPYYTIPEDDCQEGFIVHTDVYRCIAYPFGPCTLIRSYDTPYLTNCYPAG